MQAREIFDGAPLTLDAVTFILTLTTFFTVLYSRAAADRFKEMYDKVRRFSRWCLHARTRTYTHARRHTPTHADTHTHTTHTRARAHKACGVSEAVQEISIWVTSYFPGPANTRVCVCVGVGGCVCLCAAFG